MQFSHYSYIFCLAKDVVEGKNIDISARFPIWDKVFKNGTSKICG